MSFPKKISQLLSRSKSYDKNEPPKNDLEKAQALWLDAMDSYKNDLGVVIVPDNAPRLSGMHVEGCSLLLDRDEILKKMKKGAVVAEIGVQGGHFSETILEICAPSRLHLVDIDLKSFGIDEKFQRQISSGVVQTHEGDSSTILKNDFPDQYFDFIYIDGDHSYEGVKKDVLAAVPKLKEDGYLLFNDYTFWSPVECMPYGVIQAVNELCIEQNWGLKYFALGWWMYCDVAVQRLQIPTSSE